jgi:hypothetical protein
MSGQCVVTFDGVSFGFGLNKLFSGDDLVV